MPRRSASETRYFKIGAITTALTTPCRDLLERYTSLYRHWRIDAPREEAIHVRVEPRRRAPWRRKRYDVIVNETTRFEPARRAEMLPYVEWAINWEVPKVHPRFLQFHASAMEFEGRRVIFPAPSGHGKSTLTAGLLARGWRYLCDEFALVDVETLELQPYPRAICIKKPSHAVINGLGLSLHDRQYHFKGSKGYVGYVDPRSASDDAVGSPGPVRFVIFPKYVAGAEPRLTPISRADAAFALHGVCFNLLGCRAVALDVIAEMIRGAACFRLASGEINETCRLIEATLRGEPAPSATTAGRFAREPETASAGQGTPGPFVAPSRLASDTELTGVRDKIRGCTQPPLAEWDERATSGDRDEGATDKRPGRVDAGPPLGVVTRFGRRARLMLVRALRPGEQSRTQPAASAAPVARPEPVAPTKPGRLESWLRPAGPRGRAIPATGNEWHSFARDVVEAELAGIVRETAQSHAIDIPEAARSVIDRRADTVAARNLAARHALVPLLQALDRASIPVMLLKGAALLESVYPRLDLRPMSDVDLLVRPDQARDAISALAPHARPGMDLIREDFFPAYYYETELLTGGPFPLRVDLHARPLRPLRIARIMPDDAMWTGAIAVTIGEAKAVIPGAETMVIHLAAHAAYHGCARLIWLYDIKRVVATHAGRIDWGLVVDRARKWGLALPVATALRETQRRLGPACPETTLRELEARKAHWKDRLTLHAAPRAAASPLIHVATNLLSTPGVRFRLGYLLALLRPGASHLGETYPYRHRGWTVCAHAWRVGRSFARLAALPYHAARALTRRIGRRRAALPGPSLA
jgi:hypothetical protein